MASETAPIRVLLLEDSPDLLLIMKMELEWMGYEVMDAVSGTEAFDKVAAAKPDIVVSDILMPGMDGFEFLSILRKMPGMASVPAIALSGLDDVRESRKAMESGFAAYLAKPVDPQKLSALIQKLAEKKKHTIAS